MSIMTKVLAPSNRGFLRDEQWYTLKWGNPPNVEPTIDGTGKASVLMMYRAPVVRGDRRHPTDYSFMISKIINGPSYDARNDTYRIKGSGPAAGVNAYPEGCNIPTGQVGVPSWMTDKVILDALSDMNQLNANILEDLGQLRQTGEEFARYFGLIRDGFLLARARKWKQLRNLFRLHGVNLPRNVANGWLAYFYGIKPLISTLDAIAAKEEPKFRRLKVRKRISSNTSPYSYFDGASPLWGHQCTGSAVQQAQCQLEAVIRCDGNLRYWQQLGLTSSSITDAVVTAWALYPYSFVFDWFIPVENFLRTRVWSPFLEYQGGFVGKRHVVDAKFVNYKPWYGYGYTGTFPECRLAVRFYQRIAYPFTVPPVVLGIRLALTSTQIASASALLVTRN